MNAGRGVLLCISFGVLFTVQTRTLLSRNNTFRQILHDQEHLQAWADLESGKQDIARIVVSGLSAGRLKSARCQHLVVLL